MAYEGQPATTFVDLELVQDHLKMATAYVAESTARTFREGTEGALRYMPSIQFDSPLEVLFWIWWAAGMSDYWSDNLALRPQQEVTVRGQRFRVDFLIEPTDPKLAASPDWTPLAVELDGHAFHERTREQVAYRDQRDRALQAAGWHVFHFSFGEFTNRPLDCIGEVFSFASAQWNKTSIRDYLKQRKAEATGPVDA